MKHIALLFSVLLAGSSALANQDVSTEGNAYGMEQEFSFLGDEYATEEMLTEEFNAESQDNMAPPRRPRPPHRPGHRQAWICVASNFRGVTFRARAPYRPAAVRQAVRSCRYGTPLAPQTCYVRWCRPAWGR